MAIPSISETTIFPTNSWGLGVGERLFLVQRHSLNTHKTLEAFPEVLEKDSTRPKKTVVQFDSSTFYVPVLVSYYRVIPSPAVMSFQLNRYWITNRDINKKVITTEIQYYLGPESTVRAYTLEVCGRLFPLLIFRLIE
jgi:hypothetical protein